MPISVRSVAYAARAGARTGSTPGVRIHNSNCGGPVLVALRSSARARLPGNEVECDAVLGTEHRRNVGNRLVLGSVLHHMHADRTGGQYAGVFFAPRVRGALPRGDRQGRERAALVVPRIAS